MGRKTAWVWSRARFCGGSRPPRRVAAAVAILAVVPAATPAWAFTSRFPDVGSGQELLLNKGCVHCHGIVGPGGRQGPDLFGVARGKGASEILAAMWNHIPQMVEALLAGERLPSLSGNELRELVGYLNYVNFLGDAGDPERGGVQLAEMQCLACHDLRKRGKIGPALASSHRTGSAVGLTTDIWNDYPTMRAALRDRGLPWFQWRGEFLADVSSYLDRMAMAQAARRLLAPADPSAGEREFARMGCVVCHDSTRGARWADFLRKSNRQSAAENGAALLRHLPVIEEAALRMSLRSGLRPLKEKTMADLLAYLSLAGSELPGGDPTRGAALFARLPCSECHALPGRRPGIGPDVDDMPAAADPYDAAAMMLRHARDMKTATELRDIPWPRLEPDELLDLYAFLSKAHR